MNEERPRRRRHPPEDSTQEALLPEMLEGEAGEPGEALPPPEPEAAAESTGVGETSAEDASGWLPPAADVPLLEEAAPGRDGMGPPAGAEEAAPQPAAEGAAGQPPPSPRPRRERHRGDLLEIELDSMPPSPAPPVPTRGPAPPRRKERPAREPSEPRGPTRATFAAVRIERDDELPTILGKIETAPSIRVALVTHGGNREMEASLLTLKRIQRHADQTGKEIVVVTRRWGLRSRARQAGLRTSYMTRGIRWGRRRGALALPAVPLLGGMARAVLGLGIVFAALLGAFLVTPGATIVVRPRIAPVSRAIDATITRRVDATDLELAELPAQRLKVTLPFSVAVQTTGKGVKPTGNATGTVVFSNPTADAVVVPAETRVKTPDAVVFTTDDEVEVGAGLTAEVDVTALNPGPSGAVDEDTIIVLEGDLVGRVTVTNPEATDPAGSEEVPVVAEQDLTNLKEIITDVVRERGLDRLEEEHPGALIFPSTADVTVVEQEYSHEAGEEAKWVSIDATVSVTALAASPEHLRELARFWLVEELHEDEVLLDKTLKAEIAPESSAQYDPDTETVSTRLLLQGGVLPGFDPQEVKSALKGSSVEDARAYLSEQFDSLVEPVVDRNPEWLPGGMPRFDWRIRLVVEPGP